MDEIHVHKTKKSICAHFAESPCTSESKSKFDILELKMYKQISLKFIKSHGFKF